MFKRLRMMPPRPLTLMLILPSTKICSALTENSLPSRLQPRRSMPFDDACGSCEFSGLLGTLPLGEGDDDFLVFGRGQGVDDFLLVRQIVEEALIEHALARELNTGEGPLGITVDLGQEGQARILLSFQVANVAVHQLVAERGRDAQVPEAHEQGRRSAGDFLGCPAD